MNNNLFLFALFGLVLVLALASAAPSAPVDPDTLSESESRKTVQDQSQMTKYSPAVLALARKFQREFGSFLTVQQNAQIIYNIATKLINREEPEHIILEAFGDLFAVSSMEQKANISAVVLTITQTCDDLLTLLSNVTHNLEKILKPEIIDIQKLAAAQNRRFGDENIDAIATQINKALTHAKKLDVSEELYYVLDDNQRTCVFEDARSIVEL